MPPSLFAKTLGASCVLVFGLAAPTALAQDAVDRAAQQFVAQKGFAVLPVEPLDAALATLLGADANALLPADADVSPLEKALLLVDTQEAPPLRVRYLLRYSQKTVDNTPLALMSVERYNLGPAIRQATMQEYGAENTAGPAAFGVGPHVRWRFVTQPTAKVPALLLAASRQEISDENAARARCVMRSCLALEPLDESATWSEWTPHTAPLPKVAYPALVNSALDKEALELSPAVLALQLGLAAGLAERDAEGTLWNIPQQHGSNAGAEPDLVVVIDRNLGQEVTSDGALGPGGRDRKARWVRISGGVFEGAAQQNDAHAEGALQQ